jgi:hypothetical protein
MIDWLSGVSDSLKVSSIASAHACLLIDLCFSSHDTSKSYFEISNLDLVAVSCLLISAKNHDLKYPCAHNLNLHTKNKYSEEIVIDMEGKVLQLLSWNLLRFTVLDYVRFFRYQGAIYTSDEVYMGGK